MKDLVRKLRGLTGLGLTWGAAWGAIGAGIGLVLGELSPWLWTAGNPVVEWTLGMGAYGFVSGVAFGKLLWFLEGRRTSVSELPLGRTAVWGVLGGSFVPLLFGLGGFFEPGTTAGDVAGAMLVTSALGGLFAAGSVALARRAEVEGEATAAALDASADAVRLLDPPPMADPLAGRSARRERSRTR